MPGKRVQKQNHDWQPEQIDHALSTLALNENNAAKAAKILAEENFAPVPTATLKSWRNGTHRQRYIELRSGPLVAEISQKLAADWETIAGMATQLQERVYDELGERDLSKVPLTELAKLMQSNAIAAGVATDKRQLLRDRPTQIVEQRDAPDLLDAIARNAPGAIVEGTAEEIPDLDELPPAAE